jgi:hypothetical protein
LWTWRCLTRFLGNHIIFLDAAKGLIDPQYKSKTKCCGSNANHNRGQDQNMGKRV